MAVMSPDQLMILWGITAEGVDETGGDVESWEGRRQLWCQ
jgi:hypothetical protein